AGPERTAAHRGASGGGAPAPSGKASEIHDACGVQRATASSLWHMKVIVRDDLHRIFEWIAKDNRSAAAKLVARIRDRINLLALDSLAKMGRPGHDAGTRE